MAYGLRETGTTHPRSLFFFVDLRDAWIERPLVVVFAYDKLGSKPFIKAIQVDTVDLGSTG